MKVVDIGVVEIKGGGARGIVKHLGNEEMG